MDAKFIPSKYEDRLYKKWETAGYFRGIIDESKDPFSIILPPPNANGFLHLGHAMFVVQDILIRYHKLRGDSTLWFPGTDHAGIETQYVFEKELKKQGKSRFDYDRDTLFHMIEAFVAKNQGNMKEQLKRLGFALDWEKDTYTMDPKVVTLVYQTFKKLFDAGLVYRDYRLVNYCTRCGTSYSDLEVEYVERIDPLYYIKYGPFTIATVRPETKFRDTALAVNPDDPRYRDYIGQTLQIPGLLGEISMKVIADPEVDPEFGTGIMKVTPAHDAHDFDLGKKYNLPVTPIIDFKGKMDFSWYLEKEGNPEKYQKRAESYHGKYITKAREQMIKDMEDEGLMVKVDKEYSHRVGTCYKCGTVIEPLPLDQWFIKLEPLKKKAIELVEKDIIKFYPARFKERAIQLLEDYRDWNISRQIVWGMRIPAYRCMSTNKAKHAKTEAKDWFVALTPPDDCELCGECEFVQDSDTFDTWFSSAQWPFVTLQAAGLDSQGKSYFDYFYPTSVMETGYDILRSWVVRMIMIGDFATDKVPFKEVVLHGMVRDKKGQKMSKSKGNVINPIEMIDKYGADAIRLSLIYGAKDGGDISLSEEKIIGMRNFTNKIWNIGRFIQMMSGDEAPHEDKNVKKSEPKDIDTLLKELRSEFETVKKNYEKHMSSNQLSLALTELYEFIWHRFADFYIEELKDGVRSGNIEIGKMMKEVYFAHLKMLSPFMPYVTEAVWEEFNGEKSSLMTESLI